MQQGGIQHSEKDCTVELSEGSDTSSTDCEQDTVSDKMSKIRTDGLELESSAKSGICPSCMMQH